MLSIKSNLLAQNASRQLNVTTKKNAKTTEELSSGYRINRAADDAAGLAVSEKMRRQIRGLHQGAENIQDGIGFVKTADGALNEAQDIMQRINELAVKAANGTNTPEDRAYIDQEVQALKTELARIFGTTSFNERLIWEPSGVEKVEGTPGVDRPTGGGGVEPDREIIDWVTAQAATFENTLSYTYINLTNDNCGIVSLNNRYMIHADEGQGVWVTWTGYDGNHYETQPISWDEFKEKDYRFDMGDYFGAKEDNNLYDAQGEPVFRYEIALRVHEKATIGDIVACINNTSISSTLSKSMSAQFEDGSKDPAKDFPDGVSVTASLNYGAAYASHHRTGDEGNLKGDKGLDFDGADDDFFEPRDADGNEVQNQGSSVSGSNLTSKPSASTVEEARESTEGWEFAFYLDGIGKVTAKSSSVSYRANDFGDEGCEDVFWYWYRPPYGTPSRQYMWRDPSNHGNGTLGDVMEALTGGKGDAYPGLLTSENGGCAHSGGIINIYFNLISEDGFEYGGNEGYTNVGSFTISITVTNEDTEQSVLFDKIQAALNNDTILDFFTSGNSDRTRLDRPREITHLIQVEPIYADEDPGDDTPDIPAEPEEENSAHGFFVQAGPEAGMHIDIEYESLSLKSLGMESTNVLTAEDADNAINSVKKGLEIISSQRSNFGAYQNRLEHAYNINLNSEENTQYAESRIRDTDIAKLMVEYANQNILSQAGASMLAQANQQPGLVMQLLQ